MLHYNMFLKFAIVPCLLSFMLMSKAQANGPTTESELRVVLLTMEAKNDGQEEKMLQIMKTKKMTLKRLQEIITEVAIVFPYVQFKKIEASLKNMKDLSEEDQKKMHQSGKATKEMILTYYTKKNYGGEKEMERAILLFEKYAEEIESKILSQLKFIE